MYESCLEKQTEIKKLFESCSDEESKYTKIIELGRTLPPLDPQEKIPSNLVTGCQSTMYLSSRWDQGKIVFSASSDALISSGLAFLLLKAYSGKQPKLS